MALRVCEGLKTSGGIKDLRVNFISNLDLSEVSGGWSGINVAIHQELSAQFDIRFVGPVNPRVDYPAKILSKLRRLCGGKGSFHFFAERRLLKVAKDVGRGVDVTADCDFFHGPTPWILYDSPRPYFLYLDTCFSTYIDIYHNRTQFLAGDLKHICAREAAWLARAAGVFFGTEWALERAVADYHIPRVNLRVVGAGGSMTPPERDEYKGGMDFLFVALDFERKGGRICAEAFRQVRAQFPNARLIVVGERPPTDVLSLPGVSYAGFLRKSEPVELLKLASLYSTAFALIHPTSSDIQPLVISEAGYHGCPSIAANSFGIPELVVDGVTGFLVNTPLTTEDFADRMIKLAADKRLYLTMRKAVARHTTDNLTWSAVGRRIASEMRAILCLT